MKKEDIYRSLEYVRDEYLESAADAMSVQASAEGKGKGKRRQRLRYAGIAAACLVLAGAAVTAAVYMHSDPPIPIQSDPAIPTFENAHYSASDIAALFSGVYASDGATNQYTKVYVPDGNQLRLNGLPEEEYLPIYEYDTGGKKLNQASFQSFVADIAPRLSRSLGLSEFASAEDIEVRYYEYSDGDSVYETDLSEGEYRIYGSQTELRERISVYASSEREDRGICLDGESVTVRQTQSDSEIIDSLASVKEKLFDIFGEHFTDAKVIRRYDRNSEYGATWLMVYFYNASDHPLNAASEMPVSNYISLEFDNFENYSDDVISDDLLTKVQIEYFKYRVDLQEVWSVAADAKRMPLEDAEKLLAAGYVFGGHSCRLCMEAQDPVDFSDYDFVSIEYIFDSSYVKQVHEGIPFYAFYKYIGDSSNGNQTYAKTYVPAIEVSGIEEYFEQQTKNHQ